MFFDRSGAPLTLRELIRLFSDPEYRFLARDVVPTPGGREIEVVTAWLGIDQRAGIGDTDAEGEGEGEDQPVIFGTVARDPTWTGGLIEGLEWWARTESEALINHRRLLARLSQQGG
jgi:hypothetical protein